MAEAFFTCQELVEVITAYLDDALPQDERQRFEHHLAACPGCRIYLEQMRMTLRLLGTLSADDIPAALQQRLLATFRSVRRSTGGC